MAHLGFRCFAKVNLTLEVLRRRPDGYHDLASLVHTIALADDLRMQPSDSLASRVEGLELSPETNLVTRAARLLASAAGVPPNASLVLRKRIPAAAGLGGGSSDAATALVGLNTLWDTRLPAAGLAQLAATLGSDVPFFLNGGAALMRARGDDLEVLPPLIHQWLVLVVPVHALSDKTARLYAALDPLDFSPGEATSRTVALLKERLPLQEDGLVNTFSRAARSVFPGLTETWATLERICARPFFLSGAGPALFALASSDADARRQKDALVQTGLIAHAVETVPYAREALDFAS